MAGLHYLVSVLLLLAYCCVAHSKSLNLCLSKRRNYSAVIARSAFPWHRPPGQVCDEAISVLPVIFADSQGDCFAKNARNDGG